MKSAKERLGVVLTRETLKARKEVRKGGSGSGSGSGSVATQAGVSAIRDGVGAVGASSTAPEALGDRADERHFDGLDETLDDAAGQYSVDSMGVALALSFLLVSDRSSHSVLAERVTSTLFSV